MVGVFYAKPRVNATTFKRGDQRKNGVNFDFSPF